MSERLMTIVLKQQNELLTIILVYGANEEKAKKDDFSNYLISKLKLLL